VSLTGKLTIVATLLVIAVSGCAPQVDVEADAAAVRSVFDEATAALNPGGADIVDLDAEDAVIMYANELAVIGKEAIRAREQRFDDQATFEETRSVEEVVVSGDWAFVRWTGTGTVTPKDGGESSEFNRKGITIFQRQPDNSWKIARVIWNSNLTGAVQAQSGLEGEWRIEEVTIVGGANEGTYSNPQPSLFIKCQPAQPRDNDIGKVIAITNGAHSSVISVAFEVAIPMTPFAQM